MRLNATTPAVSRFEQFAARDKLDATLPNSSESSQKSSTATASRSQAALTTEQKQQVAELQRIDAHVRAHEQAHIAAGGSAITSGASFSYTYGPDGKQYAVAGEVGIDTSPEQKPRDNIDKGQLIQRAALAPSDPSPQDFRVAAAGGQLVLQGYSDLAAEEAAPASDVSSNPDTAQEYALQATPSDEEQSANSTVSKLLARTYSVDSATNSSSQLINLFA